MLQLTTPSNTKLGSADQVRDALARGVHFLVTSPALPPSKTLRSAHSLRAAGFCTARVEYAPGRCAVVSLETLGHA